MRHYRKSKASYPDGVLAVYDNGGRTVDRYCVVYTPEEVDGWPSFCVHYLSAQPYHPQGISQHAFLTVRLCKLPGEKVLDWWELPEDCQSLVLRDLAGWD